MTKGYNYAINLEDAKADLERVENWIKKADIPLTPHEILNQFEVRIAELKNKRLDKLGVRTLEVNELLYADYKKFVQRL